ncbi:hypothetical protein KKE06_00380 [Candidatus Micrarchaeota archaeon]|nr:hypothetical protein [Candidatus Micrarchaeota archaeon]MBU1930464.1 hypothetical protein [Candidatus Micrarchaeota archaeon]
MNPKILIALVFLVFLQSVFAVNGVTLTAPHQDYYLEQDTALSAVYWISNQSGQKICLDAIVTPSDNDLDVIVASEAFCLNNTEQTTITLTLIASEETDSGSYSVDLNVIHDLGSEDHSLTVKVEQTPHIEIDDDPESEYCNTETIVIPITIENNSSETQSIELEAHAPGFLPTLEDYSIQLGAGADRELDVTIHTNDSTPAGTFYYTITSRTDSQVSIQKFEFEIESCEPIDPFTTTNFEIETPSDCINIAPGKEKSTSISLENTGDTPVKIWFSISEPNGLEIELEKDSPITLQVDERETIPVSITVSSGITTELHSITFSADSSFVSRTSSFCLVTSKPFEMELLPNNVSIEQGDDFAIVLSLKSKWNTSQSVSLSVSDSDKNASVSFSRSSVSLSKYEEKTVIVTIKTKEAIALGGHSIEFKAHNSNGTVKKRLFFSVLPEQPVPPVPPQPPQEAVIEFISYPTFVDMNIGDSKELVFIIFNDSNESLENIRVSLSGLPDGVSFVGPPQFGLDANGTVAVRGLLTVLKGPLESTEYPITLLASNAKYKDTKHLRLVISVPTETEQKEQNLLDIIITGLFGLGDNAFWIGVLILVIIVALLIISWSRDHATYQAHKERWRQTTGRYP